MPRWLKLNSDVVIRYFGSYIAVFVRDISSSLHMAYMKHLGAMNPLVGKAFALAEATLLAKMHKWPQVVFESDSSVLCDDVLSQD